MPLPFGWQLHAPELGRNPPHKGRKMELEGESTSTIQRWNLFEKNVFRSLWEECYRLDYMRNGKLAIEDVACGNDNFQRNTSQNPSIFFRVSYTPSMTILLQLEEKAGRHLRIGRASIEKRRTGMCEELPGTAFGRGFFNKIRLIQVVYPSNIVNFWKDTNTSHNGPLHPAPSHSPLTLDVSTWTSSHRFPGRLSHPHNGYHRPRASGGAAAVPRFCRAHVEDTTSPRSWNQSSHSLDPQTECVQTWKMIIRCIKYTKR